MSTDNRALGADIQAHVVQLRTAALADRLDEPGMELGRQLLEVVSEAHRAQVARRVGRHDGVRLEPGLDLDEAGPREALGGLLGAREVPWALPSGEVLRVRLLAGHRLRRLV